ncbi:hypothetical protein [Piscinibacter sakaiensis]|uniref:hypothetical protein n=1 Tax=Piscinibacter sakaiensis TaxID=1547922 RepID=UPI003AAAA228
MDVPRLIAATAAASITLILFSAVVSIAPPERHVLLARSQQAAQQRTRQAATPSAAKPSVLAMATQSGETLPAARLSAMPEQPR